MKPRKLTLLSYGEDRFRIRFVLKLSIEKNAGEYPENSEYFDYAEHIYDGVHLVLNRGHSI